MYSKKKRYVKCKTGIVITQKTKRYKALQKNKKTFIEKYFKNEREKRYCVILRREGKYTSKRLSVDS